VKAQTIKIMISVMLGSLLWTAAATAQNVDYDLHWAPSPLMDDTGTYLAAAVAYEVYVRRGTEADTLLATVADTIYTLSAEPGVVQRVVVRAVDAKGRFSVLGEPSDPIYFEGVRQDRSLPSAPLAADLGNNYPNPFNPETRVVYGVPEDLSGNEHMSLEIYNVQGQLVRELDVDQAPGWHEVTWDGKNEQGVVAPTGLYLTRFAVGAMVKTGKMTMVK